MAPFTNDAISYSTNDYISYEMASLMDGLFYIFYLKLKIWA